MADDPESKIPKAVKAHKPEPTLEMNTPGGRAIQKDTANRQVNQDFKENRREDAMRLASMDKYKAPTKENVREGTKNMLGPTFNKEVER